VFLDKALKGEMIEVWGNGSVVRDYIYVQDVVSAMIKTIEYTGNERIFNIGSGKGQSLNEILDEIENLLGQKVKRTYSQGRPLDVQVNVLDIERARHCLQWTPQKSFRQGLKHTLVWLQGQLG
jgi:UDP-glucose 4-epimerase